MHARQNRAFLLARSMFYCIRHLEFNIINTKIYAVESWDMFMGSYYYRGPGHLCLHYMVWHPIVLVTTEVRRRSLL